jgi:putative membrane protein
MAYLNDPRVLFAAERTLLAWTRTALSLIALGFAIERFGLLIKEMNFADVTGQRDFSFAIGLGLIAFASFISLASVLQFRRFIRHLSPAEIPEGYMVWRGTATNLAVALIGVLLMVYVIRGLL